MTVDQRRIDDYVRAVMAHLVSPPAEKARCRSELIDHLSDAADAGELDGALSRLGDPTQAATTFAREGRMPLASVADRLLAAVIDNLPLLVVTVAHIAQQVLRAVEAGGTVTLLFPPVFAVDVGSVCISLAPFGCGASGGTLLYDVGVPVALAWSIGGLAVLEARTGTTPGKRRRGLRVVTGAGLRVELSAAIARRTSFLVGPLAWLDWAPVLWGDRRRILERLTGTNVVVIRTRDGIGDGDPAPSGLP